MRPRLHRLLLIAAISAAPLLCLSAAGAAAQSVTIDGKSPGLSFDGIGGLSAGASSRLLYDYPEPERSQILDYLFKPDYGAAGHILKVEIGGDTNSTDGSEASHMRTRDDRGCDRGYEWWLMKEAKARNPKIKLWALEWGAPGWFDGGFWSQDNIEYIIKWLDCAKQQGLVIDYVGGWNERGFDKDWYIALDNALAKRYPDVKIVAADAIVDPWAVATAMKNDPAFNAAVDIVGAHDPCGWRSLYQRCPSTADALGIDKPLWDSEQSSEGHDVGAGPLARAMNRQYIDGRMTSNINWALISAWYANLPIADTGLMLAETPWSGHYRVGKSIWVHAHTAQFTEIGWRYLDGASGYLASGASYATMRAPDTGDYSMVIETMDATATATVKIGVAGGLSTGPVHVWSTNLDSSDSADDFVHAGKITPVGGHYSVTLRPGHVYTLSTTTGQHKGAARPAAGISEQMRIPFQENFEGDAHSRRWPALGTLARYFSDLNGGFEIAPCGGGRRGACYRQVVTQKPIPWNETGSIPPTTVAGDPRWWGDYQVSAQAMLEQPGYVELLGRVDAQHGTRVSGYHLKVADTGEWSLYAEDVLGENRTLASGTAAFGAGTWRRLALRFRGEEIGAWIGDIKVATVQDGGHRTGQIGLRVSPFQTAQFDDVKITPSGPHPRFLPHASMTATATSAHTRNLRGYEFSVPNAIDDRPETMWSSEFDPPAPLPQAIMLDLGRRQNVQGLTYQPRLDANPNGRITAYEVLLSNDGQSFTTVAQGNWPVTTGTKVVSWSVRPARYVRLVTKGASGSPATAAASEINVVTDRGQVRPRRRAAPRRASMMTSSSRR